MATGNKQHKHQYGYTTNGHRLSLCQGARVISVRACCHSQGCFRTTKRRPTLTGWGLSTKRGPIRLGLMCRCDWPAVSAHRQAVAGGPEEVPGAIKDRRPCSHHILVHTHPWRLATSGSRQEGPLMGNATYTQEMTFPGRQTRAW
ncbi:uncharacterized protein CCOS01_03094 [Colletotrichum costaricense]|uniref:Uncharacterized protein n=2 Tax=Colletotrichum acutatum species complex TaxID=2707335 RepID=A0AAI9Z5S1_9PEZI|nr:uncharacterized protein CCOS01_03094 [Colletotrichum costaricense]XP_060386891.1 uncharacterized protein CTAM01_02219 [Colletotrichum tamarilloi]KAI3552418.1 hypothetical protein CSPX01_00167 [Colletotrichum filicis]KAK1508433.1 hypothetical protein CTAM01_02219 [Colletotrichum tamarilloi]KAK1534342.1 hypothetical protein CCOS01_03094 [Colletotrichum costaricense]